MSNKEIDFYDLNDVSTKRNKCKSPETKLDLWIKRPPKTADNNNQSATEQKQKHGMKVDDNKCVKHDDDLIIDDDEIIDSLSSFSASKKIISNKNTLEFNQSKLNQSIYFNKQPLESNLFMNEYKFVDEKNIEKPSAFARNDIKPENTSSLESVPKQKKVIQNWRSLYALKEDDCDSMENEKSIQTTRNLPIKNNWSVSNKQSSNESISKKSCPFYKSLPGTGVTVDAFSYGKIQGHFHSDHYCGLGSSWKHGPIYCSSVTGNLVIQKLKVDPKYVHKLPMNEKIQIEDCIDLSVTLVDANHCPGETIVQGVTIVIEYTANRICSLLTVDASLIAVFTAPASFQSVRRFGTLFADLFLVIQKLKVDPKYVHKLPMNEKIQIEDCIDLSVTLVDANHCPGSVLFLFEFYDPQSGQTKRYLHTGDFRACPRQVLHNEILQSSKLEIDALYLDTTYLSPQYCFPAQEQVVDAVIKLIGKTIKNGGLLQFKRESFKKSKANKQNEGSAKPQLVLDRWFKTATSNSSNKKISFQNKSVETQMNHNNNINNIDSMTTTPAIGENAEVDGYSEIYNFDESLSLQGSKILIVVGTYLIGKEKIFYGVAKAFKSKIYVTEEKRRLISCQENPSLEELLTNDPLEASIHVASLTSLKYENLISYLETFHPKYQHVMAFRPTGWAYRPSERQTFSANSTFQDILSNQPFYNIDSIRPTYSSLKCQIFSVPYSEHSSFRELAAFIMSLNVKNVIPTVNVGSKQSNEMEQWINKWQEEKKCKQFDIVPYKADALPTEPRRQT
ncbi:10842_t:CDS:10 [Entrophospora sp. SA101]|nr:10842_t:CDS:10 [Entrophospora sp. SA101]